MSTVPLFDLTSASDIASSVYEAFNGFNSPSLYGTLNGNLDRSNLRPTRDMSYLQIQSEAFAGGGQVGGSANMDFFSGGSDLPAGSGWFSKLISPLSSPRRWLSVPGCGTKIYVPYEAHVLILWTVTWANDSHTNDVALRAESYISLFINDDPATSHALDKSPLTRRLRRGQFGNEEDAIGSGKSTYDRIQDRYKGRTYSGHHMVVLPAGFHDIGLRLCTTGFGKNRLRTTKVRSRSLKYIYFRKGATF